MEIKDLTSFLIERKRKLLSQEIIASNSVKKAIISQIQVIESILIFLSQTEKGETTMEMLDLILDKQAKSLDELKPRTRNSDLSNALIETASTLKPGTYKQINTTKIKGKSIIAKIYMLKKKRELPSDIVPITRGADVYIARKK